MNARRTSREWSTVAELRKRLEHRWALGGWLRGHAAGEAFEPVRYPVHGPTAAEVTARLSEVQAWVAKFEHDARRLGAHVEYVTRASRSVGANELPSHVRIDSFEQLVSVLGVAEQVSAFEHAIAATRRLVPEAEAWVVAHPRQVVMAGDAWPKVLTVVRWVVDTDTGGIDPRHVDLPGIDTKFIEQQTRLIRPVLDAVLPSERINPAESSFAGRYQFRRRPTYVRLRTLGNDTGRFSAFSEVEVRADELAAAPLSVATVYVVENRATFNAFPDTDQSIVIFGGGYSVSVLERVEWLRDVRLVYWGDIDTHGFTILDRLRQRFPHVESVLMERSTLLAHLDRTVTEPTPAQGTLTHLTPDEQRVYRDLIEDRYGPNLRLEQERVAIRIPFP